MSFVDDDLAAVLADMAGTGMAVTVTFAGGATASAVRDIVGKDALQAMNIAGVTGNTITLAMQSAKIPGGTKMRDTVTIGSAQFKIRDMLSIGDGLVTHLLCEAV